MEALKPVVLSPDYDQIPLVVDRCVSDFSFVEVANQLDLHLV